MPGTYAYSTGFAALRFLHEGWPTVPVVLLGFDSHADQSQHRGQNGVPHSFSNERVAIDTMIQKGGVERCGVRARTHTARAHSLAPRRASVPSLLPGAALPRCQDGASLVPNCRPPCVPERPVSRSL
jgi:hypothetical protein